MRINEIDFMLKKLKEKCDKDEMFLMDNIIASSNDSKKSKMKEKFQNEYFRNKKAHECLEEIMQVLERYKK